MALRNQTLICFLYNSITYLQSSDIPTKIHWLELVRLARAEYQETNSVIIPQSFSQQNQMQESLHTNGYLVPITPRATPIAI